MARPCSFPDCTTPHFGKGYCRAHYGQLRAGQSLRQKRATGHGLTLAERFWMKVDRRGADECWPWTAALYNGYGEFKVSGRERAHRVAYELMVGPIPPGMLLDHTCHNGTDCLGGESCMHRRCCNPAHLEPVTSRENTLRSAVSTGSLHAAKTHCPQGHAYSASNTYIYKGRRNCRTCSRDKSRQRRAVARTVAAA